ncbi:MAG: hypothetical protein ABSC13_07725 [Dehalococcoidia bacterium]
MKTAVVTSLFGLILMGLAPFVAGCGSSDSTSDTPPQLPASSNVTLTKVSAADSSATGTLYIGDTSTGDIFQVKTQPKSPLSPLQWLSPTQLIASGYYGDYYLLDLDAKTLDQLQGSVTASNATFSHAGDMVATTGPNGELLIASTKDGHQLSQVTAGPTAYGVWAPDDQHVFWPGSPSGIAEVGSGWKVTTVDTGQSSLNAVWTHDSKSVVFTDSAGIYSVDANSGAKTTLYSWPAGSNVKPQSLRVSNDGQYALVNAGDAAGGFRALIVPLSGTTEGAQVTASWSGNSAWSTTEDVLATIADWCTPQARLLLINPDGSTRSTVATDQALQTPAFSPDGQTIAYVGSDPNGQGTQVKDGLVLRSVAGGDVVTFLPGFHRPDAWSPDGHWLAYSTGPLPYECEDVGGSTQVLPFP